jgi:ABC-type branched-chain amino acid binding protein, putative
MQVFKKICALALAGLLIGCRSTSVTTDSGIYDSISDIDEAAFEAPSSFRVGVLLPLSGDAARYGQGLKQAALMALEDMNNPNLILQFYDTMSTPEGAQEAAENALKQKAQMIIGPLTGTSVRAISDETKAGGVPVVAFSTDSGALQNSVYTLGLLVEEQVNRIIAYAAGRGRRSFALLVPDNSTGIAAARAAVKATAGSEARVVKIAFYPPKSTDFSEIIRQLSDYDRRTGGTNREKNRLKALAAKGAEESVDFDAVLIPESGARLKSAAAMFGYYDVFSPQVKFLGTSVWENTRLNRESTLIGSWYPAMSRTHNAYFNKKYHALFNEYPQSLYAFAYDAVALASALARNNPADIDAAITTGDGFVGISGMFRILPDGKNEHSLDIIEVTRSGDVVVDPAAKKFSAALPENSPESAAQAYDAVPPMIFGKDKSEAERLIFGRTLAGNYDYGAPADGQDNGGGYGFSF